jgi:hypothetical protein
MGGMDEPPTKVWAPESHLTGKTNGYQHPTGQKKENHNADCLDRTSDFVITSDALYH